MSQGALWNVLGMFWIATWKQMFFFKALHAGHYSSSTKTLILSFWQFFAAGCTERWHFDKLQYNPWRKFRQNDIFVSIRVYNYYWYSLSVESTLPRKDGTTAFLGSNMLWSYSLVLLKVLLTQYIGKTWVMISHSEGGIYLVSVHASEL